MQKNISKIIVTLSFLMFVTVTFAEEWPSLNYKAFQNTIGWPLALAVKSQNTKEIEKLIKVDKISVDFVDSEGNSLLMVAILTKKEKSIKKLLEFGANPNLRSRDGDTPFLFACSLYLETHLKLDLFKLLIKYGADINTRLFVKDERGWYFKTPLIESIDNSYRFRKDKLFYFLIEKGADIYAFADDSSTCLISELIISDRADLLKFLIFNKKIKIPTYTSILPDFKTQILKRKNILEELEEWNRLTDDKRNYKIAEELILYIKGR